MKLNPVGYGNHNNLWCTACKWGITFKIMVFFNSGNAYIMKSIKKNFDPTKDYNKLYKELKEAVDSMDFVLKTPRKRYLHCNIGNTSNLLHHLKQIGINEL